MFRISIKAIKFDEITVTFHPMNPNKPIIMITDVAQPNKGIATHLKFLKIIKRVKKKILIYRSGLSTDRVNIAIKELSLLLYEFNKI